ncbi:MAG: hypothetical protein ACI4OR_02145 [Alphaproteobacteria bacterium]
MKKNETGRSMVEMLGVLAIIGVLSVGGIAGYTMAMNKYRANEILNTASMMSMLAKSGNAGAGKALNSLNEAGLTEPYSGITMNADINGNITVNGASSEVQKAIDAAKGSLYSITFGGTNNSNS